MARFRGGRKMFPFPDVKRGQADFREFEIVSAINLAFVRAAIRDRGAALPFGRGSEKTSTVEKPRLRSSISRALPQTFMLSRLMSASVLSSG